jgi:hypothetical protein
MNPIMCDIFLLLFDMFQRCDAFDTESAFPGWRTKVIDETRDAPASSAG